MAADTDLSIIESAQANGIFVALQTHASHFFLDSKKTFFDICLLIFLGTKKNIFVSWAKIPVESLANVGDASMAQTPCTRCLDAEALLGRSSGVARTLNPARNQSREKLGKRPGIPP